jgi:hypothetical protein
MAIRRGGWKLVRYGSVADEASGLGKRAAGAITPAKLYNLARDVGEANDLSAEHPKRPGSSGARNSPGRFGRGRIGDQVRTSRTTRRAWPSSSDWSRPPWL